MNVIESNSPLNPAQSNEVANFMRQVLESTIALKADRVRFEGDQKEINLFFHSNKEVIKTFRVESGAFDSLWIWLVYDAFASKADGSFSTPAFTALVQCGDSHIKFSVQRSRTLKKTKAIILEDFVTAPPEQVQKMKSELQVQLQYRLKELDQWRKFALGDSQSITVKR